MKNSHTTGCLALLFILIWSSAPPFTKLGLFYTGPFVFLFLRICFASIFLVGLCLIMRAPWPRKDLIKHVIVAGLLIQVVYLGGSFCAMSLHTPPALFAIILGTQPILTALICRFFFKESLLKSQWIGLACGFFGLMIVTHSNIVNHTLRFSNGLFLLIALLGITIGTLYQKRKCVGVDHRTGCALQNMTGIIPLGLLALTFNSLTVHWTPQFFVALGWMVLGVSVIAFIILSTLIHRGGATQVASIFYLMPPVAAVISFVMFGDKLNQSTLIGLVIITIGIFLVNHTPQKKICRNI